MICYKKKRLSILSLLTCLSASPALSAGESTYSAALSNTSSQFLSKSYTRLLSGHPMLQLGGYWGRAGKTQHIKIQGLIGNTYKANKKTGSNGLVGIGYFLDGQSVRFMQLSYGLNWFYLPKVDYTGVVIQENLFTNLSYRYDITHYPLYAIVKSTIKTRSPRYAFTVDAGIGPNFMRVDGYKEQSLDGGVTIPDNAFSRHTSTEFAATAGVGIKANKVFGQLPLECGYRFFYLGSGHLNPKTNQILNNLKTGTVYGNALHCSLTV